MPTKGEYHGSFLDNQVEITYVSETAVFWFLMVVMSLDNGHPQEMTSQFSLQCHHYTHSPLRHDELSQTSGLKTTQFFYLTILELRSPEWVLPKIRMLAGLSSFMRLGDNLLPHVFQLLWGPPPFLGSRIHSPSSKPACNIFKSLSLSLWLWPFSLPFSLVKTLVTSLGPST